GGRGKKEEGGARASSCRPGSIRDPEARSGVALPFLASRRQDGWACVGRRCTSGGLAERAKKPAGAKRLAGRLRRLATVRYDKRLRGARRGRRGLAGTGAGGRSGRSELGERLSSARSRVEALGETEPWASVRTAIRARSAVFGRERGLARLVFPP